MVHVSHKITHPSDSQVIEAQALTSPDCFRDYASVQLDAFETDAGTLESRDVNGPDGVHHGDSRFVGGIMVVF